MKSIGILTVLLLLACGRQGPFDDPVWPDGESTEYVIFVGGDSSGIARFRIDHGTWKGRPAYHLRGIKRLTYNGSEVRDSHDVYLSPVDLHPLYSDRTLSGRMNVRSVAEYLEDDGKRGVRISKESLDDGTVSEATIGVGETVQDGNALYHVMRSVDFAREQGGVFTSFTSVLAMEVAVRWTLLGKEIQLGIPCDKIGMNIGGRGIYLWIERARPRRIVRYEDPGARMVMELRVPR